MAKYIFGRILRVINFTLLIICIINSCDVINSLVNPELPTIHVINTNLKDIEFPLSFRICLNYIHDDERDMDIELYNLDRYKKFGYDSGNTFYKGQSMFNKSLVGWNGHTENGDTLDITTEEILRNVSMKWNEVISSVRIHTIGHKNLIVSKILVGQ